ncbi:ribonuclease HII [Acetobacteraceae bacterium KSS8]|uniref:Ribonuclease HII n=1 Tax=Endosaccharibacter trunci TaxID=2812733 RepID=A0ABT1W2C9_9PROT|nr:ribonuclease HII [Acetobacteraceae bacterium KSS8]
MPHYRRESEHGGLVAGVDEAGRGPLAGPVVAAAVLFAGTPSRRLAALLDDSKKLSAEARDAAYAALLATPGVAIAVAAASVREIERLNILHASMLAMSRAVSRLGRAPELVLVDGNRCPPGLTCPSVAVIGGDAECLSIAAASIVAKVTRDRIMRRLAVRFPAYGWDRNAGYGTATHRDALRTNGATRHHRSAFGTVRQLTLLLEAA